MLDKRAGHYATGVTGMYPCSVAPVSRPVEANLSDSLLGVGRSSCVPVSASGNVARSCKHLRRRKPKSLQKTLEASLAPFFNMEKRELVFPMVSQGLKVRGNGAGAWSTCC